MRTSKSFDRKRSGCTPACQESRDMLGVDGHPSGYFGKGARANGSLLIRVFPVVNVAAYFESSHLTRNVLDSLEYLFY